MRATIVLIGVLAACGVVSRNSNDSQADGISTTTPPTESTAATGTPTTPTSSAELLEFTETLVYSLTCT